MVHFMKHFMVHFMNKHLTLWKNEKLDFSDLSACALNLSSS